MKDLPIYSERLREAMRLRHYSQQMLAEECGCNKTQISYYVNGRNRPKHRYAQAISRILGVNEDWLMGYDVPMTGDRKVNFSEKFEQLNDIGKEKAEEYIEDLLDNPKYVRPFIRKKVA